MGELTPGMEKKLNEGHSSSLAPLSPYKDSEQLGVPSGSCLWLKEMAHLMFYISIF